MSYVLIYQCIWSVGQSILDFAGMIIMWLNKGNKTLLCQN